MIKGDPNTSAASFSKCGRYRYWLVRTWDATKPKVVFCMLNPSTADEAQDDPTIRRCIGYAKAWGYGGLYVLNAYAYRATDPRELRKVSDPVGPDNHGYLLVIPARKRVIVAWGANIDAEVEYQALRYLGANGRAIECLGITKDGHPKHPLYLRGDARPQPFHHEAIDFRPTKTRLDSRGRQAGEEATQFVVPPASHPAAACLSCNGDDAGRRDERDGAGIFPDPGGSADGR